MMFTFVSALVRGASFPQVSELNEEEVLSDGVDSDDVEELGIYSLSRLIFGRIL